MGAEPFACGRFEALQEVCMSSRARARTLRGEALNGLQGRLNRSFQERPRAAQRAFEKPVLDVTGEALTMATSEPSRALIGHNEDSLVKTC